MPISRLKNFIDVFTAVVERNTKEEDVIRHAVELIRSLVTTDDWLPDQYAGSHPDHYQQHLLYCDSLKRFSLVSFVWGPGQKTPVHDHTVWGVIGMLRGKEYSQPYSYTDSGKLQAEQKTCLNPGDVEVVSPSLGDIHAVSNGLPNQDSISIHLYGANIGEVNRHIYKMPSGEKQSFVSGYANADMPNIWRADDQ